MCERSRALLRSPPAPPAVTTPAMPPAHPAPAWSVPGRRTMRRTLARTRQWTGSLRIGAGGRSAPVRSGMTVERLNRQGSGCVLRPQAHACTGEDHASKQRAQRAATIHFVHGVLLREVPCPLIPTHSLRQHSAERTPLMLAPFLNSTRNNKLMPTTISSQFTTIERLRRTAIRLDGRRNSRDVAAGIFGKCVSATVALASNSSQKTHIASNS